MNTGEWRAKSQERRAVVIFGLGLALISVMWARTARAQAGSAQALSTISAEQLQARHQIAALESVLENAVGYGAQMLSQHVQSSATPESVLLTGQARAHLSQPMQVVRSKRWKPR